MTTYPYAGSFSIEGVGINSAPVDAWDASRFGSPPALNAAPPSGTADATATTDPTAGFDGAFVIALPTTDEYYIRVVYTGVSYWQGPVQGAGAGGGGGSSAPLTQTVVTGFTTLCGPETSVSINASLALGPLVDPSFVGGYPFSVTFIAPASGKVEIEAEVMVFIQTGTYPCGIAWAFADGATGLTAVSRVQQPVNVDPAGGTFQGFRCRYHDFVSGLTPGDTYNWQLSGTQLAGDSNAEVTCDDGSAIGDYGAGVLTVWAA